MSETPILDLERDPPKARSSWTPYVIGGLIGLAAVRWVSLDALWCLPLLYASIAIHELGHLAAGKLVGMETGGIVIGGLVILRSGDRWIWRFEFRRILSGGIAKPLTRRGFNRPQHAWMVAGGPLATLALAAVTGGACCLAAAPPGWMLSLFWLNIFLLCSTLIPAGAGVNKSDVPRLWQLLHDPDGARSWLAVIDVQSEETTGVLPRDWNAQAVEEMLQCDPQSGDNAYRQMLGFYRSVDQRNDHAALLHLERALASSARGGRTLMQWCYLEAACASAILRGNPANARIWLERATHLRKPLSIASIEAAIAQSEGRHADAIALWDAALAFLARRKLDSGLVRYAKLKIAEYRAQCRAALERGASV